MKHDKKIREEFDKHNNDETYRREFLIKAGRYAAYTAPVVLMLLASKKSEANPS